MIGSGGPSVDLSTTSAPVGSDEQKEKEKKQKQEMNPLKALFKMLNIDFGENLLKIIPNRHPKLVLLQFNQVQKN